MIGKNEIFNFFVSQSKQKMSNKEIITQFLTQYHIHYYALSFSVLNIYLATKDSSFQILQCDDGAIRLFSISPINNYGELCKWEDENIELFIEDVKQILIDRGEIFDGYVLK